jgi:hypothetical protein
MRARLTSGKTPILVGLMAAVFAASFISPALGGPSVNSAFSKAKKALSLAQTADKKAKKALNEGARAYINVESQAVDTARSTAGTSMTRPSVGRVCVRLPGVSSANNVATATPDKTNADGVFSTAVSAEVQVPSTCPTSSDFEVIFKSENAGASGFMDRTNVGAFSIVVP